MSEIHLVKVGALALIHPAVRLYGGTLQVRLSFIGKRPKGQPTLYHFKPEDGFEEGEVLDLLEASLIYNGMWCVRCNEQPSAK